MMQIKKTYRTALAVTWFALASVLFFLPGSALPDAGWLSKIWFDKWVHIGLFAVLLFLWSWALELEDRSAYRLLFFIAVLYGFFVEVIQYYFIENRSFDVMDMLADATGSIVGLWCWNLYKKNRPL